MFHFFMYFQMTEWLRPKRRPVSALFQAQASRSSSRPSRVIFLRAPGWVGCRNADAGTVRLTHFDGQIGYFGLKAPAKHKSMFEGLFQLPHVFRPGVIREDAQSGTGNTGDLLTRFLVHAMNEVLGQQRNIFPSRAQGRDMNGKNLQPVVKILPEKSLPDPDIKILMGGRDNADILPCPSMVNTPSAMESMIRLMNRIFQRAWILSVMGSPQKSIPA